MQPRNRLVTEGPIEKWLLVEGPEDFHTICQLLDVHGIHDGVTIESLGGYDEIRSDIRVRMKDSDQTHFGIIVDADTNLAKRWESLHSMLEEYGYRDIPVEPTPEGTIVYRDKNPQKFGIWLMPDNQSVGMLEDFARMSLPDNDKLWERALASVDAIPAEDRLFKEVHIAKARIKTWLAWQKEPGMSIGRAIHDGKLNGRADVGQRLVNWHRTLFDL